jgi:hypothetical protein
LGSANQVKNLEKDWGFSLDCTIRKENGEARSMQQKTTNILLRSNRAVKRMTNGRIGIRYAALTGVLMNVIRYRTMATIEATTTIGPELAGSELSL